MPAPSLLDHRLLIVAGKGGVGRSSLAAAMALSASRAGKRTLVCEINAQERVAPLLGAAPSGTEVRPVLPGVSTVDVTPESAMREYGLMVLKYRTIYDAVFENRVVKYFLRVVPSLAELVILGKVLHEVRAEERGRRRWDLVIVDAPATGHAVQLLRTPGALLDTVPAGPLRRDAQWMRDLLIDPAATTVALVTLPEELPVNEAIELDQQLRSLVGVAPGALIVNGVPEPRFAAEERQALAALEEGPAPLGAASKAAVLQGLRAELAARQVARLRAALELPVTVLPLLAVDRWDRAAVEALSRVWERGGAAWAR